VLVSDFSNLDFKTEAIASTNALVNITDLLERGGDWMKDQETPMKTFVREIVAFSSPEDEVTFDTVELSVIPPQPQRIVSPLMASPAATTSPTSANASAAPAESHYQYPQVTSQPPVMIPSGIPATWSEHLKQQQQQGLKSTPSLPSLVSKNENSGYYDPHAGKPVYPPPNNRPPPGQYPPNYGQLPHDIPSPSTIDIAASGGFWSTLQKQPNAMQQRWDEPAPSAPVTTETLTKEQRVLHDDLVTAIYAYNVNAAVSTLRKMYTKQTRTFRIPTVLGILLPDTAAMIVDGRTDLLNVAVCFALDSIQWCFGVQKGENIESFKYKMNANIARWILHETVKKGIPTTPTPVIQEATISVVNHILENVVELEFAWEMLTTLNISHPVQRVVPHVLAWRGYPNPSIEARVNEFLYDHPEIGNIIPPSNPNMHMPPQPPLQFRPQGGPVSPTGSSIPQGPDRTSHMVQAFLRDQQRHHSGMDYPIAPHLQNQPPNQMPPDGHDDQMMDRNLMKLMGRPQPGDLGPRMSPMYRDEFGDPMRLRGDPMRLDGSASGPGRMKANPPNPQGMRGRFPGDNSAPHMEYHSDEVPPCNSSHSHSVPQYPMHHHAFANPRGDDVSDETFEPRSLLTDQ
jgi:hypothetical protein